MKRLRLVVLSICLGVVCLLVSSLAWADKSAKNDKIVAKVGKQVLTAEALNQRVNSLPPEYQKMIRQNPQFRQSLIDRWVQLSLLSQEARARKLDRDRAIAEKINELVDTVLAQEFVTKYVFDKIEVTDKEISNYYSEHKAEFEEPEMVKARHILAKVPPEAKPDDWASAEARIREIKKRLDGGEDFAATAQASSEDPGSKDKGGELGFFPRGQMVPEFEKAAFALRTGEVSEPVKTAFGYHIIKAEDRKEAKTKVFNEVKEEVKNRLIETKQEEAMGKLFLELKNKYGVTINP
ncbi:MAG: peptidylprolyl isomerase [Deltaproteobacteria bacterium]|nr:peptidylprolyl isomerase [Deltaproteobacteria bacterium]